MLKKEAGKRLLYMKTVRQQDLVKAPRVASWKPWITYYLGLTLQVVSFNKKIFPFEVDLKCNPVPIGPALGSGYKLMNCLEVTHMQTVQSQFRRHRMLCLTRLYILCFHNHIDNVLLKVCFRRNVAFEYGV